MVAAALPPALFISALIWPLWFCLFGLGKVFSSRYKAAIDAWLDGMLPEDK